MLNKKERITFGKHKGSRLIDLPDNYLNWMVKNLKDSDRHLFAIAAEEILRDRELEDKPLKDLEKEANDFLKRHGFDPYNM